jgi:dethiobiotin synthetase
MKKAIFVTGTGTDVGKTFISALLMQAGKSSGLPMRYFKPVQTGECGDCDTVKQIANLRDDEILQPSYSYPQPMSPHFAAAIASEQIDIDTIVSRWNQAPEAYYIVEGAGGLLVPLGKNTLIRDLIKKLNIPVLIVAKTALGTINHTLLTIEAIQHAEIPLLGIVLNGKKYIGLESTFRDYADVPVIAEVPQIELVSDAVITEIATPLFSDLLNTVNGN